MWREVDIEQTGPLEAALDSSERMFLATAYHPQQGRIEQAAIGAARRAGVAHIVKLSAQSAGLDPPLSFGREHAAAEAALAASGCAWTALRPVFFMQSLLFFVGPLRRGVLPASNGAGRVAFVDAEDIARSAAAVLDDPEPHQGRAYVLTGPSSHSFAEVAQRIGARSGRSIRHVSPPAWLARLMLPIAAGMPRWQAGPVVELLQAIGRDVQAEPTRCVAELTGRAPDTLDSFLDRHRQAFQ